jgi:DNA-binding LacI/PurR family transcriptional regulator
MPMVTAGEGPTITDVAQAAGVSVATVSRVLSGRNVVSDELTERVMAAVHKTDYSPLRHRSSSVPEPWVAVLIRDVIHQFYIQVLGGIQEQTEARGYFTTILRITEDVDQIRSILRQMRSIRLAGVLALGMEFSSAEWIRLYEFTRLPFVVLNTDVGHPKIASILVSFEQASAQAARHLIDLGHTRIAYLGDHEARISSLEFRGIKSALAERGLPYLKEYDFSTPRTREGASQGVSRLMGLPSDRRPTAICAFDDEVAMDVLNVLRYYDVRVPEDMSVVGFDDIPMAAHTSPPLTTLDVPKRRIGRQMVLLLDELARNERSGVERIIVEVSLLVRRSTGPAPKTNPPLARATDEETALFAAAPSGV